VPLEMVWIPAGTFIMGSHERELDRQFDEGPQHEVTLTQGFWLDRYEVTKRQWEAVMGTRPWERPGHGFVEPDSPAVHVSWNDAQAFIDVLNALTGETYRLPTEAQWEYACRAGIPTRFYWGDDLAYTAIDDYAWWEGCLLGFDGPCAHTVGLKSPNAWGLFDMSGNVWEWCQDWAGSYPGEPTQDPGGPATGFDRVVRGGGADGHGQRCRSASRACFPPDASDNRIGFRLAR